MAFYGIAHVLDIQNKFSPKRGGIEIFQGGNTLLNSKRTLSMTLVFKTTLDSRGQETPPFLVIPT